MAKELILTPGEVCEYRQQLAYNSATMEGLYYPDELRLATRKQLLNARANALQKLSPIIEYRYTTPLIWDAIPEWIVRKDNHYIIKIRHGIIELMDGSCNVVYSRYGNFDNFKNSLYDLLNGPNGIPSIPKDQTVVISTDTSLDPELHPFGLEIGLVQTYPDRKFEFQEVNVNSIRLQLARATNPTIGVYVNTDESFDVGMSLGREIISIGMGNLNIPKLELGLQERLAGESGQLADILVTPKGIEEAFNALRFDNKKADIFQILNMAQSAGFFRINPITSDPQLASHLVRGSVLVSTSVGKEASEFVNEFGGPDNGSIVEYGGRYLGMQKYTLETTDKVANVQRLADLFRS
jgi:hypothetical protein